PLSTTSPTESPAGTQGPRVLLKQLRFTGNHVFDDATLRRVADLQPGTRITFGQLKAAAARVTAKYRAAGYLVARAYIPKQNVAHGTITLGILEGTLDGVDITNHGRISDNRAARTLTGRLRDGSPLQRDAANR